ncbi:MAG TPA: NAD(P)/FAD-dependent oxidoreductase [Steroidobacteraceae bacterium]|nr:NAD(P)/FAD-dependent oxidoreductase [Steroidobacteraceae bacterium]
MIAIGSGVAAAAAATRCRAAGWRVAIVDQLPVGGTCALRGCDPKKVLVGASEALDAVRRLRGSGIGGGVPGIDWPQLMRFKRGFTDPVPAEREQHWTRAGIEVMHGRARFVGPRTLDVDGRKLPARFILIAAGAVPAPLGIDGEEQLVTSTDFLALPALPARVALVGGGYIAAEFSHLAVRAGARVTVVQRRERLLPQFDPDLVAMLTRKSTDLGIELRLGSRVQGLERTAAGCRLRLERDTTAAAAGAATGAAAEVVADLAVHAAGRVPDLAGLDLAAGGVQLEHGRLQLNEFLQSRSNPAVYAAGDAASDGAPLTPVASHHAQVIASNLLGGNQLRPNYQGVPSIVFTTPPLARVGLLEQQAGEQGLHWRSRCEDTAGWYTARRLGEDCAGFKVLVEEPSGRILGAHLLGPQADEVINLFALAIRSAMTAEQLKGAIFGYPTAASDIQYML